MVVLHIDLSPKPGLDDALIRAFLDSFSPVVAGQAGFQSVALLRNLDAGTGFRVTLAFESEEKRQVWVASEAHVSAWGGLERCCASYATALFDEVT